MYEGYEVPIVLGQLGLQTDGPQSQLPPNAAIKANNVAFFTGVLSKSNGTTRYSTVALANPIIAAIDWWPTPSQQRLVAITSDGRIWKDTGTGTFSSGVPLKINETQYIRFSAAVTGGTVTWRWNGNNAGTANNGGTDTAAQVQTALQTITGIPAVTVTGDWSVNGFTVTFPGTSTSQPLISTASSSLVDVSSASVSVSTGHIVAGEATVGAVSTDSHMVAGGNEVPGNPRRLFIYTYGVSQLLMMTGDSASVTAVSRPAADWTTGKFPTFGFMYNSRHIAISQHTLYISKLGDHTDFTTSAIDGTGAAQFAIFPGEGDLIIGAYVFKGGALIFKRPFGMYLFNWNGGLLTDPTNVSITKISDVFAIGSPHSDTAVLDDLIGESAGGSLFSQKATNAYGSLEQGDLLQQGQVRNYIREQFAYEGIQKAHAIYYPEKILAMFSGRSQGSSLQDQILMYDAAGQSIRYSIETKDKPTVLFLRKDANFILRPFYGANDGYVYQMDQSAWNVNGAAYLGEFQTPYIDFSFLEPKLAEKVKLFDFLSVTFQHVGNWAFYVDVYVDGIFIQTLTYQMNTTGFQLDVDQLDVGRLGGAQTALQQRKQLKSCSGKSISFRIYNGNLNQSFTVERLTVSFRESGEQSRSSK